jgi:hypothetical protein
MTIDEKEILELMRRQSCVLQSWIDLGCQHASEALKAFNQAKDLCNAITDKTRDYVHMTDEEIKSAEKTRAERLEERFGK